jgi:malate dehydrogenase (oxaloacetate-decarboxylating)
MFKLTKPSSFRVYRFCPSPSLPMRHLTNNYASQAGKSQSATTETKSNSKYENLPLSTSGPINCALSGTSLLNTPYLNKGSAFPPDERRAFNLTGLLPQGVQTLEQQCKRAYEQYSSRPDDLAKNTFLTSLKDQNEVLYYKASSTYTYMP